MGIPTILGNYKFVIPLMLFCLSFNTQAQTLSQESIDTFTYQIAEDEIAAVKTFLGQHPTLIAEDLINGNTAIHIAAYYDATKVAKFLAEQDVPLNAKNEAGITPLHFASMQNSYHVLAILLSKGVDGSIKDNDGVTARYYAEGESNASEHMFAQPNAAFKLVEFYDFANLSFSSDYQSQLENLLSQYPDFKTFQFLGDGSLLHRKVYEEEVGAVEVLLSAGFDANLQDSEGRTPLMKAARYAGVEETKLLLENGAKFNIKDNNGLTALQLAKDAYNQDVAELLSQQLLLSMPKLQTLITHIKEGESKKALKLLDNNEFDYSFQIDSQFSLFTLAVFHQQSEVVGHMLRDGVDINQSVVLDEEYLSAIDLSIVNQDLATFELLLKGSTAPLEDIESLLSAIIKANDHRFLALLIKAQPEIKQQFAAMGLWEIEEAYESFVQRDDSDIELYKLLLANIPSLTQEETTEQIDLVHIIENGNTRIFNYLLPSINNLSLPNEEGTTPLLAAIYAKNEQIFETLIDKNQNLINSDLGSELPIDAILRTKQLALLKYFTGSTALFSQISNTGETLAGTLLAKGHFPVLRSVIEKGLNPNTVNGKGETLLIRAVQFSNEQAVKELLSLDADPNLADDIGNTPLIWAVKANNQGLVKRLVNDTNVASANGEGMHAIHFAAKLGNMEIVKRLIKEGALLNQVDKSYLLPWHYAFAYGHDEVVKTLVKKIDRPKACQNSCLYDDPLVQYINALYLSGKHKQAIREIEDYLTEGTDNPLLPQMWVGFHDRAFALSTAWKKASDEVKTAVGKLAEIEIQQEIINPQELLTRFPSSYSFQRKDVFALLELSDIASEYHLADQRLAYLLKALNLAPDFYQIVWKMVSTTNLSEAHREQIRQVISAEKFNGTTTKTILSTFLKTPSIAQFVRIQQRQNWLQSHPMDGRAAVALAYDLENGYYYKESLPLHIRGMVYSPFYSNYTKVAEVLFKLNQPQDSDRYLTNLVGKIRLIDNKKEQDFQRHLNKIMGDVYSSVGEESKAREVYKLGIKSWPEDERNYEKLAQMERNVSRNEHALDLYNKAYELKQDDNDIVESLIATNLALNRVEDAKKLLDILQQRVGLTASVYSSKMKVAKKRNDTELARSLNEQFLQQSQSTNALMDKLNWLVEQEYFDEMRALIESSISTLYFSNAQSLTLAKLMDKHPDIEAQSTWQKLMPTLINQVAAHTSYVETFISSKNDQIAYWRSLYQSQSDAGFALDELANLLDKSDDWESFYGLFNEQGDASPNEYISIDHLSDYIIDYAWLIYRQSLVATPAESRVKRALLWLETYKQHHGTLSQYYRYRQFMFNALQQKEKAADALLARSKLLKDSTSIFHDLIALYSQENRKHGFMYGHRMLQRNPYSSNHSYSYIHKHGMWGGSPIAVLKEIDRVQRLSIEGVSYKNLEKRALGQLGDTLSSFNRYRTLKSIHSSQRYVDWFNAAKKDSLFKDTKTIQYDFNDKFNEVRIIDHEGFITVRRDHPIYGNLTYAQRGAAWVKVEYTATGNLRYIETSNGKFTELFYDNDKIARMIDNKSRELTFEYNKIGKPSIIRETGEGELQVSYDDAGNILKVSSSQGHKMALQLTQAFQNLLSLSKIPEKFLRSGVLPEIAEENDEVRAMRIALEQQDTQESYRNYISYLVKNVKSDRSYYQEAKELLDSSIESFTRRFEQGELQKDDLDDVIFTTKSWKSLMSTVKSQGLPLQDYGYWQKFQGVLKNIALTFNDRSFNAFVFGQSESPLVLLNNANWLHQSNIVNEGYWSRFANSSFIDGQVKPNPQAILARNNGDLVVGTDKGLMVFDGKIWHHYVIESGQNRFVKGDVSNRNSLTVLSLTEVDSKLWVGTNKGLFKLTQGYTGNLDTFSDINTVMESSRINALTTTPNRLLIATQDGLYEMEHTSQQVEKVINKLKVTQIISSPFSEQVMLLTEKGLRSLASDNSTKQLTNKAVKSAVFLNGNQVWFLLASNDVYRLDLQPKAVPQLVANQAELTMSKTVHGLSIVEWDNGELVPVVLTDLGLNLYSKYHMQFMELPFKRERQGVQMGASSASIADNGDLWLVTSEALYGYSPSKVNHLMGKVNDMVEDPELGGVYVATEKAIYLLDNSEELQSVTLSNRLNSAKSNSIALADDGDLFAHDGFDILRFKRGSFTPQVLFNARPNVPEDIESWWQSGIKKLFVDSNDTLWVVAGSSVWKWQEGQDAEEFNYALDDSKFPSRSQLIFNVYEDVLGKIRVVASNESHLRYKGRPLEGGELVFNGKTFNRAKESHRNGWFVSGYTPIDEDFAIVSTNGAFYRDKGPRRTSFSEIASFEKMRKEAQMIYLGGKGSQFSADSNTWLFPSAGGIVAYHNERWFYPDRLNQLLTHDAKLGQYGGRAVNSVHVDKNGRVYAGTDVGLMIFDADSVESFLISQNQGNLIFIDRDDYHLSSLKNIFVDQIDPKTPQGRLVKQLQKMEGQIEKLESSVLGNDMANNADTSIVETNKSSYVEIDDLKKRLAKREKARQRLLAKLEAEHFGLFQMLKLDPREAQQMGKKLSKNQVLVQYLPTPKSMYINIIEKNTSSIVEVPVTLEQLNQVIANTSSGLRAKSSLSRGITITEAVAQDSGVLKDNLTVLYDWLLRPIEGHLKNKDHVFISSIDQLTYIPFSALIRENGSKMEYAIERYNLGVIPSLYHLDLVLSHQTSFATSELLAADPDGSLPGARQEVNQIKRYMEDPISLIGESFSAENLSSSLDDARIVHLATHGVLDSVSPADSYILLANGERLDIPTIATMDLSQTELVVLSACETGIGKKGLEMATLARAFALSNVPTVIASLWKVDDQSTSRLMTLFYRAYQDEQDTVKAFAQAQRRMIKGEAKYSHPSDWSAFNVIGKP